MLKYIRLNIKSLLVLLSVAILMLLAVLFVNDSSAEVAMAETLIDAQETIVMMETTVPTDIPTPTVTPTTIPTCTPTPTPTPIPTPTIVPTSTPTVAPTETSVVIPIVVEDETYLGEFMLTGYCACSQCCGWSTGITASGRYVTTDPTCHTVAVDRNVIPLGTYLTIDYPGFEGIIFRADDTGSAVRGNHIDIYFATHSEALAWSTTYGIPVYSINYSIGE